MPLYFAFGSNMDAAQMARRCPGAEPLGLGTLAGHRLVFRGPSRKRGGGVLSVDLSPVDAVEGILYSVTVDHLEALDRYEGAPQWYVRAERVVEASTGGPQEAVIYRLPEHVTELPPTAAYLAQVAEAFATHGLDPGPLHEATDRAKVAG
jgi:hypothetical protein